MHQRWPRPALRLAWAQGYADGEQLPTEALVRAIEAIARVISVPLTVDLEGGHADDADQVAQTVSSILAAGTVDINIEDGVRAATVLSAKIAAAPAAIAELVEAIHLPLNVMIVPGLPPVAALSELGVRRISAGPAVALQAYGAARRAAVAVLREGSHDVFDDARTSHAELNELFPGGADD
jgi:2-methylisocitrate lyase-like PEP mutase family enzyme